jgi:hypothetical protein
VEGYDANSVGTTGKSRNSVFKRGHWAQLRLHQSVDGCNPRERKRLRAKHLPFEDTKGELDRDGESQSAVVSPNGTGL